MTDIERAGLVATLRGQKAGLIADVARLRSINADLLAAAKATLRAIAYGPLKRPEEPGYVNPAVVLADRQIACDMPEAAVAKAGG